MKKVILIISAALISASPASAQSLFRPSTSKSNPTMIRTPPSSSTGCRTVAEYVFTHIDVPDPSKKLLRSDFS